MLFRIHLTVSSVQASLKDAETTSPAEPQARAFPINRYALFFSIAVCGAAADLGTKYWIFSRLGEPTPPAQPVVDNTWWLWEGYFGFQTAVNQGALFGMGKGNGLWFAALSVVAAVGILIWLFYKGAARDRFLTVALACVMAGIFGNLFDRVGMWDAQFAENQCGVRDWILIEYDYPWFESAAADADTWLERTGFTWIHAPWPNFNIADSMLVCGAAMLFLHAFRGQKPESPRKTAEKANPS